MAELVVNKKSIYELLNFSKTQSDKMEKFVIPYYQRPYAWDLEKCETLWNDIIENAKNDVPEYFFGTIVTYKDGKNASIIDGQQRITSFFLLLRAFYHKFEMVGDKSKVAKLVSEIETCIWDTDKLSGEVDKTKFHIQSLVATEDDIDTFSSILETGEVFEKTKNNYSVNYRFFRDECEKKYTQGAVEWRELCYFMLHHCIVLPIECDKQETALTIFNTLNNRGLPLADSDIFKAKIYEKIKTSEEKKAFAEKWKELTQICKKADITIDDIFRCYMHIKRSQNNDSSREVGMRRFYDKNKGYLEESELIAEIEKLTYFWQYVNLQKLYPNQQDDGYSFSTEAKKWLHCLSCYPNDYWKFPVAVFFLKNRENDAFDEEFCILLKKLIALLFSKFIVQPTVNAIRDDVFKAYIAIHNDKNIDYKFDEKILRSRFAESDFPAPRLERSLLLLDAYLVSGQDDLIPADFHVEHILPQNWKKTYYDVWQTQDEAKKHIDMLGNKIALEFKINIAAGDKYFAKKKEIYTTKEITKGISGSKIRSVLNLAELGQEDWGKSDIERRQNEVVERIIAFFNEQI